MSMWIAPAKAALAQLDAMEAKGFHVDRSAEFRQAVMDVRVSLSIPVERAAEQQGERAIQIVDVSILPPP